MELEELIGDMYTDRGSMEEVLTELGDPAEFAKQYQGDRQYLIGPEYFETYLWFVKVVLVCTAVPILMIALIRMTGELSSSAVQNGSAVIRAVTEGLTEGFTEALTGCVSAFGGVTLIFALMERKKIQIEKKKKEKWSVEHLSEEKKQASSRWTPGFLEPVPDQKAIISRGESIVGIVFIMIFSILLIFAPHFFGAYFNQNGTVTTVPVFNLKQWGMILPVFILSLIISLADEILRLIIGVYCRAVMISNLVCGTIQLVLTMIVLKVLPVWNPDFVNELEAVAGRQTDSTAKFFSHWNAGLVSNGLLTFIVLITFLEMGTTVYKTIRYGAAGR